MPHKESSYKPPFFLRNNHVQTVLPTLTRNVEITYERERISTPDGDFLDIDWSHSKRDNVRGLIFLCHGLESSSYRHYMKGMAFTLNRAGWDTATLNFRSCSGEMNWGWEMYHSGKTDDVHTALTHCLSGSKYSECGVLGFSLGGNVVLKYVGENPTILPNEIRAVVGISVPCDLVAGAKLLAEPSLRIYTKRFLFSLCRKVEAKAEMYRKDIDIERVLQSETFEEFDGNFTAPIHGFSSAMDYWTKCSSKQFLPNIRIPTLVLTAQDDPMLPDECYPYQEAANNAYVTLETPQHGGHVGFREEIFGDDRYFHEGRAVEFFDDIFGK